MTKIELTSPIQGNKYEITKHDPIEHHPRRDQIKVELKEGRKRVHQYKSLELKAKPRYTIDGFNHPKGLPIRFKSLERITNYMRNKGM